MKEVHFHHAVAQDIAIAEEWYRERDVRLADRFLDEIEKAVERLPRWFRAYPVISAPNDRHEVRRIRLWKFPYALVYTTGERWVHVLAIGHMRRRPFYWVDRLGETEESDDR